MRILILLMAALPALAQPAVRWTNGFNQGVVEAMIRSADDSHVSFACPTARPDTAPSITVRATGRSPSGTLRLVIDGRTHEFALQDGAVDGRAGRADDVIREAATALARSTATEFTARIPELGWSQVFPMAGAREALTDSSGRTIVDGCLR